MHILITRPEGKGTELALELQQAGYQTTLCPVLTLDYLTVNSSELAPLENADKIIFISQDAVHALLKLTPTINKAAQLYAVGQQTADAVYEAFGRRAAVPKQHDSEGLLELKTLQDVELSNIVLVKGEGGRTTIAKTLKQRGALLNQLVVYKRSAIESEPSKWMDHWQTIDVEGIVITSNAAVDAIFNGLNESQLAWLKERQFFVASERIADYLKQQNVARTQIHIAAGASDGAMFTCINQQGSKMSEAESKQPAKSVTAQPEKKAQTANTGAKAPVQAKKGISKTGSLALLISLLVAGAVGYEFYLKLNSDQQSAVALTELTDENQRLQQQIDALKSAQQTMQHSLYNSEQKVTEALNESAEQTQQQLQAALKRAEQQTFTLNPQEVTSLQRMAEFKLWAEHDYQGAAAVLSRLDSLLAEHPGTGAIRQAIHQDLQTLHAIEPVAVEAIYLKLHGINQKVDELVFNAISLPEEVVKEDPNQLSENVSEWRQNLAKSWQQFKDFFVEVRTREDVVIAPFLSEQERHLVKQRLSLYLAQAQDAVLSKQSSVYFSAVDAAHSLVKDYFKQDDAQTKAALKSLAELSKEQLDFSPKVSLQSTEQVKEWAQ
ncbi:MULTISPECIES: uroporphyrinogen-III synthase [Pseudoalteromonas]|uniref:uroporphyrinogen-III synthase n=1 Tax=Pseudoalteromonas TaxID=53246 RepID=UPI0015832CD2|nr:MULTISPECIES: uroporphyrinogen-III synthase [Pseudoalteromonas]MDI4652988.1 uroporphyrinogen-III C-methyltransferase [Pseudoalteromonas shioyasakiensis]NUJ39071.1 uroporphyrinogen-III synthase [Pseudoalteromonas sp. 0303]